MKVERSRAERSERAIAATQVASDAPTAAFAAALRQHRQRQTSRAGDAEHTKDSPSARRATSRASSRPGWNRATDESGLGTQLDELTMPSRHTPGLLSLLIPRGEHGSHPPIPGNAQRGARRRRESGDAELAACIEVTHAHTGTRCVLSRQDGVWILSLHTPPAMSPADMRTLAETLRAHFAERGLGPVDIIL